MPISEGIHAPFDKHKETHFIMLESHHSEARIELIYMSNSPNSRHSEGSHTQLLRKQTPAITWLQQYERKLHRFLVFINHQNNLKCQKCAVNSL